MTPIQIITIERTALEDLIRNVIREEMTTMSKEDTLLTVDQVAEILQIHPQTAYTKKKEIGFIKEGRAIRFRTSDVQAYILKNKF